jgi:hypothetical protein
MHGPYISALRGARAIRKCLYETYGQEFEVTVDQFAGGTTIYVEWTGGPSEEQVQQLVYRFEIPHHRGPEDLYCTKENDHTQANGGAKYLVMRRHHDR